jgi:hypothetical protein
MHGLGWHRHYLVGERRNSYQGLERAWITNAKELNWSYSEILKRATLREWHNDVARGELPAVIFNSTIVETGERLTFSTAPCSGSVSTNGLETAEGFQEFSSLYEGADIAISTAVRLSSTFPFISPAARPLPAVNLSDGKPLPAGQNKVAGVDNGFMNLHLADGGYCDNSGVAALAQWLHNGLSELADRNPLRLPKQILVIRINAFPAAKQGYIKEHRGNFFQFWAPLLTMNIFRGATHTSSADRELELLSERWGGEVLGNQQRQNRGRVRIKKVDFTFSPSSIHKRKGPPLSWHLRTEEQAEIDHAWTSIRTGEQTQKVLAYLGLGKGKRAFIMPHQISRFSI